jgi:hypothetical protein
MTPALTYPEKTFDVSKTRGSKLFNEVASKISNVFSPLGHSKPYTQALGI